MRSTPWPVSTSRSRPTTPTPLQTISLHGHDESQTAVTLDGIPLSAPGTAANLRGINTDLFTGAGASFGARAGALGGGVNFTTLQPTQTWQYRLNAADGSFDKYNWSLGATGSIGKLGIAVLATKRGGNNPLTFQVYRDQSGFTYGHAGESTNAGLFLKLRYGLTENTTLVLTALQNKSGESRDLVHFAVHRRRAVRDRSEQYLDVKVSIRVRHRPIAGRPSRGSGHRLHFDCGTGSRIRSTAISTSASGLPIACPEYQPFATDTDSNHARARQPSDDH